MKIVTRKSFGFLSIMQIRMWSLFVLAWRPRFTSFQVSENRFRGWIFIPYDFVVMAPNFIPCLHFRGDRVGLSCIKDRLSRYAASFQRGFIFEDVLTIANIGRIFWWFCAKPSFKVAVLSLCYILRTSDMNFILVEEKKSTSPGE